MTAPHVVLVGLMGSGKSTVGKRVAAALEREFVDADEAVVEHTGRSIADLFAQGGEGAFRRAETEVLLDLLGRTDPLVIAAGGGVVVTEANRERLRGDDVVTVWLRAGPAFLASRVKPKPHRPLLLEADPLELLSRMAAARDPWYREVADVVVDVEPVHRDRVKPKDEIARLVLNEIRSHAGASS